MNLFHRSILIWNVLTDFFSFFLTHNRNYRLFDNDFKKLFFQKFSLDTFYNCLFELNNNKIFRVYVIQIIPLLFFNMYAILTYTHTYSNTIFLYLIFVTHTNGIILLFLLLFLIIRLLWAEMCL